MILPTHTIVLVIDGARMLILRNSGDAITPDFEVVEHRQYDGLPNRAIAEDAPGRTFASFGTRRSSYEVSALHERDQERFIVAAAVALDKQLQLDVDGAVVVAPPPVLGLLRKHYGNRTKTKMLAEIEKDFTQLPVQEIVQRLLAL